MGDDEYDGSERKKDAEREQPPEGEPGQHGPEEFEFKDWALI